MCWGDLLFGISVIQGMLLLLENVFNIMNTDLYILILLCVLIFMLFDTNRAIQAFFYVVIACEFLSFLFFLAYFCLHSEIFL